MFDRGEKGIEKSLEKNFFEEKVRTNVLWQERKMDEREKIK